MRIWFKSFGRIVSGLIAILMISVVPVAAQNSSNGKAADEGQRIYVCNQGEATLSVIDVETNEVVDNIDLKELGFSVNAKPHHTVAEADGSFWYVSLIGANRVLKFNRQNELVGQAKMEVPGLMSLHPTKDLLLVGRSMSAVNPPQSMAVIRRSDMSLQKKIETFFARPHAIATTPDGSRTFIASLAQNQILSVDVESGDTELATFGGETQVFVDFAISPDGNEMVATGQLTGKALVFDISDPLTPEITDTIEVGAQPWHPVYSPNGKYVYFGNKGDHTVSVLNMESHSQEAIIKGKGLAQPHGSAFSADGKYLYISNNNRKGTYQPTKTSSTVDPPGTITVINTQTREVEKVIEVGVYPSGIGTRAMW